MMISYCGQHTVHVINPLVMFGQLLQLHWARHDNQTCEWKCWHWSAAACKHSPSPCSVFNSNSNYSHSWNYLVENH